MSNRATRRAEIRLARRRAKAAARSWGCRCSAEVQLDPLDGRPIWARRPDSDKRLFLTKHRPDCPIWGNYDQNPEYFFVIPPEPGCSR
jgi:hypothetical protein